MLTRLVPGYSCSMIRHKHFSSRGTTLLKESAIHHCMNTVKKYDYDHYLCTLLLPRLAQPAAFVIRAFNVEVAQIHDVVTEKRTGQFRIQFWRDLLDSAYKGEPLHQPVAMALTKILESNRLSKHWFTRLLEARELELSTTTYLSTVDMETYAENTFSSLLYLTLEAVGVRDVHADHAASHVGKAEGIVTLLRSIPYYRMKRKILLPMDILMRHGASQEDFLRGKVDQVVRDAVYDFASLAHVHLSKARSLEKKLSQPTMKVLLPTVVCEDYLKRIQAANFDPLSDDLIHRNHKIPLYLLWRTIRKTF